MTLPADMSSPIFVYYELTNFYQNHRRCLHSSLQLAPACAQLQVVSQRCCTGMSRAGMTPRCGASLAQAPSSQAATLSAIWQATPHS